MTLLSKAKACFPVGVLLLGRGGGWLICKPFKRFVAIYCLCFAEGGGLLHAETGCWGKAAPC